MTTDLSEKTIGAILEVANTLGAGFLEKVYERALVRELGLRGMRAEAQVPYIAFCLISVYLRSSAAKLHL